MAPLTEEDRILIRILRAEKGYNAHQMMIEFSSRKWNKYGLHRLIKQIDATGTSKSRNCGRKRSARTAANIAQVQELICSQDNNPGTSKSPREIERATGISRSTVRRIAKHDLNLYTNGHLQFQTFVFSCSFIENGTSNINSIILKLRNSIS